jgi:ubiquinone/menaquinone biosynthesis C-methylase UbiE
MSTDSTQNVNNYFTDPESATEMARLIKQAHMLTEEMGGSLADQQHLTHAHDILDLACGPGEWVIELASMYPDKQVTGIDVSQRMIEYAKMQALRNQLHNAHFKEMDILQTPLRLPYNAFDIINMRLVSSFMFRAPDNWSRLLQECMQLLRPGGVVYVTDSECTVSNSPATEKYFGLMTMAGYLSGNSFSVDGRQSGVTPMLGRLLRLAGYQNIQHRAFAIDGSAGSEDHQQVYEDAEIGLKALQPLLVRAGLITQAEVEALYYQVLEEMRSDDFNCLWYFLTIWGEKSRS